MVASPGRFETGAMSDLDREQAAPDPQPAAELLREARAVISVAVTFAENQAGFHDAFALEDVCGHLVEYGKPLVEQIDLRLAIEAEAADRARRESTETLRAALEQIAATNVFSRTRCAGWLQAETMQEVARAALAATPAPATEDR